jgi:hypothetical protein
LVSGGNCVNSGCSRAASAFSSASAATNARASAAENLLISAAVCAVSPQAASTSPSSRATWSAGSHGIIRSPCCPRRSSRITSGRSIDAM